MPVRHRRLSCSPGCAVEAALQFIDGKWKGVILYHLFEGTMRFNELNRRLETVSPRMLTAQLRELERHGLVRREVYAQVPPRVEYSLTELGRTLEPSLRALREWGEVYAPVAMERVCDA